MEKMKSWQMGFTERFSFVRMQVMSCAVLFAALPLLLFAQERRVETMATLNKSVKLDYATDFHLTDTETPVAEGKVVNLISEDAWLFFDNVKPNDVIDRLSDRIKVNGKAMVPEVNARVVIYCQGAVVIPHGEEFSPLVAYTKQGFGGDWEKFSCNFFYTNKPSEYASESMVKPLRNDNSIRSLKLKRGYMATLANNPDGMGYSRVFIADSADVELSELSNLLDGKVSFVRVMPWQYVSKKGWAGSVWKSMPEGLKYVGEQCDYTNSTWFYNWSATTGWTTNPNATRKSYNQEFVPEKWGAGGDFSQLYDIRDVSHLMAYNEPDHTEQSNVSVEKAIEEWPVLQSTGLRLGSPATTDFNWLYSFMSEARKRNYRVDYVVVHAYWGGLSGAEWYEKLREVHERTGRPIWIKEWNNGANWTHEGWPSGTDAQQAKQLRDLKDILTVMDTARFVERYSIYNWVEDKRAIILPNAKLTPAGEYYKANNSVYFFSHEKEVVPVWTVRTAPVLSYRCMTEDGNIALSWSDENTELISRYVIECSDAPDFRDAEMVATMTPDSFVGEEGAECSLPLGDGMNGIRYYRVKSVSISGTEKTSNVVNVGYAPNGKDDVCVGEVYVTENWSPMVFGNEYDGCPATLLGIPTYRNKLPLSARIKGVNACSFDFRLTAWDYQLNPSLANPDTVAYMVLPCKHGGTAKYDWNGVNAQVAVEDNIGREWKRVLFDEPFSVVPVVIPCQITDNHTSASSVRIRNVDESGFEVRLRYEGTSSLADKAISESVVYLALTPGTGNVDGRKLLVGSTPHAAVGDNLLGGYEIDYSETGFDSTPLFFGAMQTEEDTITSTLRIKKRDASSAVVFKDREKSVAHERVKPERVGWIAIAQGAEVMPDGITENRCSDQKPLCYDDRSRTISSSNGSELSQIAVFDLRGRIVASARNSAVLSLAHLPSGIYLAKVDEKTIKLKVSPK